MTASRENRPLTQRDAERAVYIDFEGTESDPPSFLGVFWVEGDDSFFVQLVLEEALWPAAVAKSGMADRVIKPATWAMIAWLREMAQEEERLVIAWSDRERKALVDAVDVEDRNWFEKNVINAIPLAKAWKRKMFPEVVFERDPKYPRRGKHRLDRYFRLIGYEVPNAFGPGNSAKRIRATRQMLAKRNGDYAALTRTVKGQWTKALQHNWYDCDGLRELVIRFASD